MTSNPSNTLNSSNLSNYNNSGTSDNQNINNIRVDISGTWYLVNRTDISNMYYYFVQNGTNISFTIYNNGYETGKGNGTINNNTFDFVIMDQQSKWTGTFLIA